MFHSDVAGLAHARRLAVSLLIAVLAALGLSTATARAAQHGDRIPGHYIVTVAESRKAKDVADDASAKPKHLYRGVLNGFAAELSDRQVEKLERHPHVVSVTPDAVATADTIQNMNASGDPWGLDRIDQRALPLSRTYSFNTDGRGVRAYVLDTGIQNGHAEFQRRVLDIADFVDGTFQDCRDHGTHVAGTIAGATFGVAKQALLRDVRVLGCDGTGSFSDIIAGMDLVRTQGIRPAVVNMSLSGPVDSTVNAAVTNLSNAGFFVAVSAGNSGTGACTRSPASAAVAYTVAASDRFDRRWSDADGASNHGSCVDTYAPGVAIRSAVFNGASGLKKGTSMATPHVAGVAALIKSALGDQSSGSVTNRLNSLATTGAVSGNPAGTVNRMLFKSTF